MRTDAPEKDPSGNGRSTQVKGFYLRGLFLTSSGFDFRDFEIVNGTGAIESVGFLSRLGSRVAK
ncbi:hypothetical protein AYM02_05010 [Coxiella burnetii]|nr:hypothetical protein AYM38_04945 [Coxiella burnetii]ARI65269.1 hypothetical protein B7L74_01985 [Coxiella burnetii]ARK26753.1 hypothetical protein BMW92_01925 [Coxiella burnetii]ATN70570.1 hypothetical protein AYM02_05010 [Coxiella burnetii]ATN72496.1 hypothetical protein AYM11_04840 [Coxiella burnetii]